MRTAIVGGGVSGLVAAWMRHEEHEVTVFESGDHPGGYVNTVALDDDGCPLRVDTGFIGYSKLTIQPSREFSIGSAWSGSRHP